MFAALREKLKKAIDEEICERINLSSTAHPDSDAAHSNQVLRNL